MAYVSILTFGFMVWVNAFELYRSYVSDYNILTSWIPTLSLCSFLAMFLAFVIKTIGIPEKISDGIVERLKNKGVEKIKAEDLYKSLGADSLSDRRKVGILLKGLNITRGQLSGGDHIYKLTNFENE